MNSFSRDCSGPDTNLKTIKQSLWERHPTVFNIHFEKPLRRDEKPKVAQNVQNDSMVDADAKTYFRNNNSFTVYAFNMSTSSHLGSIQKQVESNTGAKYTFTA